MQTTLYAFEVGELVVSYRLGFKRIEYIYCVFPVQLITNPILLYTVRIIKVFIEIDEFIINLEPYRIRKYVIYYTYDK